MTPLTLDGAGVTTKIGVCCVGGMTVSVGGRESDNSSPALAVVTEGVIYAYARMKPEVSGYSFVHTLLTNINTSILHTSAESCAASGPEEPTEMGLRFGSGGGGSDIGRGREVEHTCGGGFSIFF